MTGVDIVHIPFKGATRSTMTSSTDSVVIVGGGDKGPIRELIAPSGTLVRSTLAADDLRHHCGNRRVIIA